MCLPGDWQVEGQAWLRLAVLRMPGQGAKLREGDPAFTGVGTGFRVGLCAERKCQNLCCHQQSRDWEAKRSTQSCGSTVSCAGR